MSRVLMITDGENWYVRRVRVVEHDLDRDEKVYRCDKPIGLPCDTPEKALATLKQFLKDEQR